MGIDVGRDKAVSINETHEHGVDTSEDRNPTVSKFHGMFVMHVFRRNQRGTRSDDGNPLIYALKSLKSFSITRHWESWLFRRALAIIAKERDALSAYDLCIPIPSSSPFCERFAAVVSDQLGIDILVPTFIRKRTIGAVLADATANPPKVRRGAADDFKRQLRTWTAVNGEATYQAKDVATSIRTLFKPLETTPEAPDLTGLKVLIVDDLFATGSSLLTMRELLEGLGARQVGALCFLSGNGG